MAQVRSVNLACYREAGSIASSRMAAHKAHGRRLSGWKMTRLRCDVVCAFIALSNMLSVCVTADVIPEYTSLSGRIATVSVHLAVASDTKAYSVRVRREATGDKTSERIRRVETMVPMSSSWETVDVTRESHSTAGSVTTTLTMSNKMTTKEATPTEMPNTTEPLPTGVSATTMKTITKKETNHTYYTSRVMTGSEARWYFVSYKEMKKHGRITHKQLSSSYRKAVSTAISFTFPFYGHELKTVTIATGGFLYMSDFLHRWLTSTQYIAPLMANFDTSLRNKSRIHYADNGTAFIVLWENLLLKDNEKAGPFTFEAILHKDGTIIFSYYQIPIRISSILEKTHPVKVGLSDAFYIDTNYILGRPTQRTIYRYHRVDIDTTEITNHTAVVITPITTCNNLKTCTECLTASISFKCIWCPVVGRCSSGLDRKRQEWLENSCHLVNMTAGQCPNITSTSPSPTTTSSSQPTHHHPTTPPVIPTTPPSSLSPPHTNALTSPYNTPQSHHISATRSPQTETPYANTPISPQRNISGSTPLFTPNYKSRPSAVAVGPTKGSSRAKAGVVFAVIMLLCLICGLASWLVYAYRNPNSKSGLWLIKHRPSQVRKQLARVRFRKDRQSALEEKYSVSIDTPSSTFA